MERFPEIEHGSHLWVRFTNCPKALYQRDDAYLPLRGQSVKVLLGTFSNQYEFEFRKMTSDPNETERTATKYYFKPHHIDAISLAE